ncbi:general secretion pathway protein D [gamma proteobacterium HTCC5015]|nr:general secretion pathway protein D [gamma proteobacterium HTCC5015]
MDYLATNFRRMSVSKALQQSMLFILLLSSLLLPAQAADEESFTLNLKDADIEALISTVAKKTGRNFVIDPRVKARVTVISSQAMSGNELYEVFQSILQVHGYAAVPAGDVIKILPEVNAKQGAVPTITNGQGMGDDLVTQVIPIRNVAAAQLVPILRPLVPQQGHLAAYSGSNIIVITDRASNISRLADIIGRIDRPDNDEIESIQLEHASAPELVRIINSLSQGGNKGAEVDTPQLAADERTNSILISGSKAARDRIKKLIASMDTPLEQGGNTKVVYLKYAKAEDMAEILKGVNEGQKKAAEAAGGKAAAATVSSDKEVDIQADPGTNSLIITAAPDALRNIESVVRQLDIRRAQVHVEAIIVEVSDTAARELGFSYLFANENGFDNETNPVGGALLGGGGDVINGIAAASTGDGSGASVPNGFTVGFGDRDNSGNVFAGILRAVASDTEANLLSTPSIVTLDNEEAEIVVGQNVPFVTGSYTTASSGANNPFQTVERQDVGVTLKITPQINEGDVIRLDIEQEASSVVESSVASGQLITNKREIKTSVMIEDGQMLVLGGLIDDQTRKSLFKVPLLGDIPLLGRLFQYRTNSNDKRNLMVFLHPKILRDRLSADATSQEKYQFMRGRQREAGDIKPIFNVSTAALPPIAVYDSSVVDGEALGKRSNQGEVKRISGEAQESETSQEAAADGQ